MKKLKLTDIAPYSGKRVQPFDGVKRYMSTGDLKGDNLSFEDITYESKPSRADILVSEGDILFAKMTNTNKALKIDREHDGIIVSTGFSVHRPIENELFGEYFFHFLKHNSFQRQKNKLCTGAIQSAISNSGIEKILVPIPDYNDQIHIANLLNKAENLIAQRKESIRLLDEFLKSTFLEMFFSNPDSEKWVEVKFEELADKKKGSMRTGPFGSSLLHSEFTETGDVKVLGIDNVVTNKFDWKRSRCITIEKYQELKRYTVFPNDVLISIMATLGRTAVVPKEIPLCINSKHLAAITLDKNIANPYFVAYAFHSHPFIVRQMSNNVKGAIMDGLNLTIIRRIKMKLPPIELQNKFGVTFEKTETLKTQYQQSLQELENLYGSLSQKAFRGELGI
jgi:type I restriction enzyme S subunit